LVEPKFCYSLAFACEPNVCGEQLSLVGYVVSSVM
jgi:hypothetical protein